MKIIKFIISFLLLIHSSSFIIIPSLSLFQMSKPMNNINSLTIRRYLNDNNNHNKSNIFKFEINDINDNLVISSIIMFIYFYVNYWLISLFFNFFISITS